MMSVDEIVKLLDAIVKLINVLVWPAILFYILRRFGQDLRDFIKNLGELTLKGGGFEASLKPKQDEVAAALAAATAAKASHSDGDKNRESAAKEAAIAADVASEIVTARTIKRVRLSKILWVNRHHYNNRYEREALEALGVSFILATSTEEALTKISQQRFDAIISNMERPPDPRAGYTLLDQLRHSGDQTPFCIYSSSRDPEHVAESLRHGALGCTNNPNELIEMVLPVLGRPV